MQATHPIPTPLQSIEQTVIEASRQLIEDKPFQRRHCRSAANFTRHRLMTLENTVVFILQKTVRSIQLHLHSFFDTLGLWAQSITPSAWCQARMKLQYSAFIELNQRAIVEQIYQPKSAFRVHRWRGLRLLGIDSSLIRLPNVEKIGQEFGWAECANNAGECGRYPQARLSALTDLLNRIVIEAAFVPWKQGERCVAAGHLAAMGPEDLAILDRGYACYWLLARFIACQRLFVCRCSKSSFSAVNELFKENKEGRSVIVKLVAHHKYKKAIEKGVLPPVITLRFVTVRLSTGELEVLATNLLDEQLYPTSEFAAIYQKRWGIETYYGVIKGRLDLENFTGRSSEAVRQDVYSTIFLSNLESVLIRPAQEQCETKSKSLKNPQQVNHAVSFHAIKSHLIALILSKEPLPQTIAKLQQLFLGNTVSSRPGREVPRLKQSVWRSYRYQRNVKKGVF